MFDILYHHLRIFTTDGDTGKLSTKFAQDKKAISQQRSWWGKQQKQLNDDEGYLKAYSEGLSTIAGYPDTAERAAKKQELWNSTLGKGSNLAQELGKEIDEGRGSIDSFVSTQQKGIDEGLQSLEKKTLGQSIKGALGSLGSRAANMALDMAMGAGISVAIQGLGALVDYAVNYQDRIIEKGQEAQGTIKQLSSDFQANSDIAKDAGSRYIELSKGIETVGQSNRNLSLTNGEYEEFLELSNQLSSAFPTLVAGYDAEGNAILNLSKNTKTAQSQLNSALDSQRVNVNSAISKELPKVYKGVREEVKNLTAEREKLLTETEANDQLVSALSRKNWSEGMGRYEFAIPTEAEGAKKAIQTVRKTLSDLGVEASAIDVRESGKKDQYGNDLLEYFINGFSLTDEQVEEVEAACAESGGAAVIAAKDASNQTLREARLMEKEIAAKWNELTPAVQGLLQSSEAFTGLDDQLQTGLMNMVPNLDYGRIESEFGGDIGTFIRSELIKPIAASGKDVQQAYKDLFTLDQNSADMSLNDFVSQRDKLIDKISGGNDDLKKNLMQSMGYLDDNGRGVYKQQLEQMENMLESTSGAKSQLKELSREDFEIAYDILINDDDNAIQTISQLQNAIKESKKEIEGQAFDLTGMSAALETATANQTNLTSAVQESVSATGLSTTGIENLTNQFSEMEGFEPDKLFEKSASGVRLNRDALAAYRAEQEKIQKNDFAKSLDRYEDQIQKANAELATLLATSAEETSIASQRAKIESLEKERDQVELLQAQYNGLTSDYAKFMESLSSNTEDGTMYDNAASGYQTVKELFKEGWTGTEKAKTGLDYYWSGDASNLTPKEIESTWKTLQPLLDTWYNVTDSKGNVLPMEGIKNFVDDVNSIDGATSDLNTELKTGTLNLQDLSNAFGISEEAGMDLAGKLKDAGWDINVEGVTQGMNDVITTAEEAQGKIKRLTGDTYEWDFDTSDPVKAAEQVDRAMKQLSSYQTDEGYDYSKVGAQEAAKVYESTVRQQQEVSKPGISDIDPSSVVASSKEAVTAAQNLQAAKDELDIQTQLAGQGLNNNLEGAQSAANEALNTYKELQAEGKDPFDVDTSGLQEAEDSMAKLSDKDLELAVGADTSKVDSQIQGLEGNSVTINAEVFGAENVSELSEQLASLPPNEQATVNVSVTGKEDVSNLKSSLENIPDNTPTTINCTVSNQEELDSIRDKVSELNSSGKEITLNATIGTVDTSNIDSATSSVESLENKSVSVTFTVTGHADIETAKTALEALEDKEISLSIDGGDSSQITSIKTALEGLRDENVNISVNISGQSDAESLQKAIETLESKDISVSVSADGVGEVTSLKDSISGLVDKSISISVTASGTDMVTALKSAIDSVQGKDVSVTATVNGTSDVLALKSAIDSVHSKSVTVSATTTGTGGVQALAGAIASVQSKTVSIHANYSSSGSIGGVAVKGTAHASGTTSSIPKLSASALASGSLEEDARHQTALQLNDDWKTKKSELALTGELGPELVVHGNRFFTVGEQGAEFASIPAGSIVFNHKQTEELLSKGIVKSGGGRGKTKGNLNIPSNIAHASGTAYAEGSESKWKNSIDWIERLVESLEYVYTAHQDSSELAVSLSKKNKYLDKAIADNQELIKANQKGDRYYYDKAVSVGLSKELRDKARTGDIKIEDYDEGTQQKIKDYQEMLDKSRKCREAVRDLRKEQKKLVEQKFDNLLDRYDALQGIISGQQGVQEARQKYYEASGHGGNKMVRESVQEQLKYQNQMTKSLTAQKDEYKALMKQAKKAYGTNSNEYKEAAAQYYKLKEGIWESRAEAAKLTETLREIEYTKLQNVIDRWGRASDRWSTYGDYYGVDKRLSPDERRTKQQTAYQKEINANNKQIVALDALLKKKQEYLLSMHFNDKAYTETAEEVKNLQQEIVNLGITNEELRDKIRASRWEVALANLENLKNQLTEIEDIRGMLNQDGLINKEDASLSKDGYANLALIREGMSKNLQLIANYTTLMGKLDEELKNGNISQEDYNTEMQEFSQGIRDAAKNNKQYKDSLIDMYTTQLDYANEALQKNIDKRREALEAKKDYYDYDRNIKKQTKDIRSLQAQIAALEGTTNAADRARLAKLREELADTQDNLDDDLYSHKIELELSGYDELKNSANEALDATLNYLKTNTDAQKQVVDSMLKSLEGSVTDSLGNVTSGYENAMNRIQQLVSDTAIITSQAFKDNFKDIFDIIDNQLGLNGTTSDDTTNGTDTSPIPGTNGPAQDIVDNIAKGDGDGTKLKSVKLSETSIKLVEGESKKLVVTASPENASNRVMSWSTNSPTCVGITTPKGADTLTRIIVAKKSTGRGGSATVTVTPNDVGQKPITCKVKIITQTASILEKKAGKGASNDGLSQVNQVLAKFDYGQASKEQMLQFAKDYDVSGATMDNITSKKIQTELAAKLERRFIKDNIYNAIKALPAESRDKDYINKLSAVAQHVSKTHGKALTSAGAYNLATIVGLKHPKEFTDWTSAQKNTLLDKLKYYGFSSGGSIRKGRIIPTSEMSKIFKEAAINNGDDGWASVNLDEHIFNNDQLQSVISVAQSQLLDSISGSYLANAQNIPAVNDTSVVYHYDNLLNVQGDVTKEVLPDLQTILKESYKYTVKQQTKDFTKKKRR